MSLTDATGVEVQVEPEPRRIVSLVPSLSELLHRLGVADRVVGLTTFCVAPAGGFPNAERVRGTKNPDVDAVRALEPDLVLANLEENRERDVGVLREAGVIVHVSYPRDVDGARQVIEDVARLVGRPAAAQPLLADLDAARVAAARRRAEAPLEVLCPIWRDPWMAAGSTTYVGALLAECGLRVRPDTGETYPEVVLGEVLADVDAVLLPDEPFPFTVDDAVEIVGHGVPVRFVEGAALTWHSSRTASGLRLVSALAEELVAELGG